MINFREISVHGVKINVFVDSFGKFSATLSGTQYTEDSFERLLKILDREARLNHVDIQIPFTHIDGRGIKHGIAYGINARTGAILVRFGDNGSATQISRYDTRNIYKPLKDADLKKLEDLTNKAAAASEALENFENRMKFDVRAAIESAVQKAMKAKTHGIA